MRSRLSEATKTHASLGPIHAVCESSPVFGAESSVRRFQLCRERHGTHPSARIQAPPTTTMTTIVSSAHSWLLAAVVLLALLLAVEGGSITPEDVRFAMARCQNDSTEDPVMRLQWSIRMFPDTHETHCYVKCLLSKLGLINVKYLGLDGNKFMQPLESRDMEITEECYTQLEDVLSGTCEGYYRKWMDLRKHCKEFFYVTLFEDPRELDSYGRRNYKQLGETASEFCYRAAGSDSVSEELTSEQAKEDDVMSLFKSELQCLFRHIRWFDAYGRVDLEEMQRSFKESKCDSKANFEVLARCVHTSNAMYSSGAGQMAYKLYQCLMKSMKNFKEIYTQRDKISRYY